MTRTAEQRRSARQAPPAMSQHNIVHTTPPNLQSGINSRYQSETNRQNASRASRYSPSASHEGRQDPTLAGKSERAVPGLSTGDALGNDFDGSKKMDPVCQTTLLENITLPIAGTSTAAKSDRTLPHHLDTRILDLATTSRTILLAKNTTMVHLVMLFARQGGL